MTERGVTIGRVAAQVGLTRKAIRFYERKSLIPPPERGSNRYRLYDAEAVEMLRFIKQAQFVGLKLAEIKEIVAIRRRGKAPCARVQLMLQNKVVDLGHRLAELTRLRGDLHQLLKVWNKPSFRKGVVCSRIESSRARQ